LNENQLLVVCDAYRNFQKDPIDCVSSSFKNIFVSIKYNPIAEVSKYINVPSLNVHRLSSKIDVKNKPSNVHLYPTPVFYLPTDSQYKKLGNKHYKQVIKVIKRNDLSFDLVHSHFTWSSGYVGAKLKEKYGVPLIITAHGYDIYKLPFKDCEWESKIEYVLNSANTIITVSNSNLECIKKLNVKTSVTVLPNGYREELFHPIDMHECRKLLGLPTEKKIILSVGNLEEVKGHKYLVEAMEYTIKKRKDVICLIVGSGKLEIELKKQIKSAGLQNYVKLVGAKPHSEIPLWMNACDLFTLPSLSEGNPTVMFECLGCGKPFVGTKVGGIPEIIISNEYGLLCEPARPKELAENILLGVNYDWDSDLIKEYSSQFSWSVISEKIYKIYSQVSNNNYNF
jgi:glycosyltransferase involved in cell wall biosynthesis